MILSLERFMKESPKLAAKLVRIAQGEAVKETGRRALEYVKEISPAGGILSKPTKAHAPGLLRKSWKQAAASGERGREASVVANTAPHALIIDMGRRRAQTYRSGKRTKRRRAADKILARTPGIEAGGKMLGSKLAPKGINVPAWKRISAEREAISKLAFDRAVRSIPEVNP